MNCLPETPALRRYTLRFLPAMTLYVAALWTVTWIFRHGHPTGPGAYVLAILPGLPILSLIVIVGLYLAEEKDEFQRNLLVQAMVWSTGATLATTTIWGFLENFLQVTRMPLYLVFPLFWCFVGLAAAALKWRYR